MQTAIFILAIVLFLFLGLFVIPQFLTKRAMRKVVKILRKAGATSAKTAKLPAEVGLSPRSFMEGMFRGRDYKQPAIGVLRQAGIVGVTEEGKVFLLEDRLQGSRIGKMLYGQRS